MLGIENLKKVFALLAGVASVGDKVGHETNWSQRVADLIALYGPLQNLTGLDWAQVMPEFKDLDAAEQTQLVQMIDSNLTLVDKALEAKIEALIGLAAQLASTIEQAIEVVKSFKEPAPAPAA